MSSPQTLGARLLDVALSRIPPPILPFSGAQLSKWRNSRMTPSAINKRRLERYALIPPAAWLVPWSPDFVLTGACPSCGVELDPAAWQSAAVAAGWTPPFEEGERP